jgi:hypothetical protein
MLAGFMYRANGPGKHPTMLLLHGFPGNERNPDLAQAIRGHGWNVVYFDYRGLLKDTVYYDLANDGKALAHKQIVMLDEHTRNKQVADNIRSMNAAYFDYEVWHTDHSFTNKRVSLIHSVIAFLDGPDKTNCCETTQASEAQIRTARASSNEAIARQDVDGIVRDMLADSSIVTGRGNRYRGRIASGHSGRKHLRECLA